jgi:hypothetical protein
LSLRATAANEGNVLVVGFVGDSIGRRFCGDDLNLPNQITAPGLIDPAADFALQRFDLVLPGLTIGRQFETVGIASNRPRVRREGFPNDRGPRARKPGERRFGPLEPAHNSSQEFSRTFHRVRGF